MLDKLFNEFDDVIVTSRHRVGQIAGLGYADTKVDAVCNLSNHDL